MSMNFDVCEPMQNLETDISGFYTKRTFADEAEILN